MSQSAVMRFTLVVFLGAVALVSCSDPLGPLIDGRAYPLGQINGQTLPWTSPAGGEVLQGWIKIDDDTLAERYELLGSQGIPAASWQISGRYSLRLNRLIIEYQRWHAGIGNLQPADTFYVSGNGLVLRELVGTPDSMVRYYARP